MAKETEQSSKGSHNSKRDKVVNARNDLAMSDATRSPAPRSTNLLPDSIKKSNNVWLQHAVHQKLVGRFNNPCLTISLYNFVDWNLLDINTLAISNSHRT